MAHGTSNSLGFRDSLLLANAMLSRDTLISFSFCESDQLDFYDSAVKYVHLVFDQLSVLVSYLKLASSNLRCLSEVANAFFALKALRKL